QGALGEGAVPDLTPTWAAKGPRLADREGRKVVMVHVALELVGQGEAVQLLLVGHRAEGGDGQRLGLAASEESGAVRSRQDANLDRDLAHVLETPAVHTDAVLDHALAHPVLDRLRSEEHTSEL